MRATEEDLELLRVVHARVDELKAERASWPPGLSSQKWSLTLYLLVFASYKLLSRHVNESWAFWCGL